MAKKKTASEWSDRALRARLSLFKAELVEETGKRIAAEQEATRLKALLDDTGGRTVTGIGSLSRRLGYSALHIRSLMDGDVAIPHTFVDGTATFDLAKVHRWMLDRREARVIEACREDVVEITSDFDFIADTLTAAIQFVTEEIDQTISDGGVPGRPDTVLEDEHFGPRLARLADLGRRLREAHADVPAPPCTPGKPAFVNLTLGHPWKDVINLQSGQSRTDSEEAR